MAATAPSAPTPGSTTPVTSGPTLRYCGVWVLVMFLLTSAVGGSLASEGSYLWLTLVSHIGLALVTLGVAGYSASVVGRSYRAGPRAGAGMASLAALGATVAGTVYLLHGQSDLALYGMEGFAVLGIVAAIVMILVGGPAGKRAPAAP